MSKSSKYSIHKFDGEGNINHLITSNSIDKLYNSLLPPIGLAGYGKSTAIKDALFQSVAQVHRGPCAAALLTGMGSDGADGMQMLYENNKTHCIAQDQDSCVVYGMPRVAIERKIVHEILPIHKIGIAITKQLSDSN